MGFPASFAGAGNSARAPWTEKTLGRPPVVSVGGHRATTGAVSAPAGGAGPASSMPICHKPSSRWQTSCRNHDGAAWLRLAQAWGSRFQSVITSRCAAFFFGESLKYCGKSPAFCIRQIVGAERRTSCSTSLDSMMSESEFATAITSSSGGRSAARPNPKDDLAAARHAGVPLRAHHLFSFRVCAQLRVWLQREKPRRSDLDAGVHISTLFPF